MYPHQPITAQAVQELSPERRQELATLGEQEKRRISSISSEQSLRIEMDEAAQKWTHAYEQLKIGSDGAYMSVEDARFEMGLANYRYWQALAELDRMLDRTRLVTRMQFWVIIVGGLILALVSTIFTVLSYFKD